MRTLLRLGSWSVLVGLVIVSVGCSSGGSGGTVAAGSDAASGQLASIMFVQQWGQGLWGLVASQTGTQTPEFGDPTPNPDGSISVTFKGVDGTVATLTQFPDGTVRLDIEYADGSKQTVLQSKPVREGTKSTTDYNVSSGDGLTVAYTAVVDNRGTPFDISDDTTELKGSSVLPKKLTQGFTVMTADGTTKVDSRQSDGSTFALKVPLGGPDFISPTFAEKATGAYRAPGLDIRFDLESTTAAPSRWGKLTSDFGDGLTGEFALEADFSGSGRLLEDGEVMALISWTRSGKTQVSFVSAGRGATNPAGAAVDYLTHRWQTLSALLAPGAGVSAAGDPWAVRLAKGYPLTVSMFGE